MKNHVPWLGSLGYGLTLVGWRSWPDLWSIWLPSTVLITGLLVLAVIAARRPPSPPAAAPANANKERSTMINVEQYKNWCTQQIARLVMEQQLHVQSAVQRGPFTLTYTLRLTSDPANGLRKLLGLGPTLQMVLQAPTRLQQSAQGVLVEVELPKAAHITPNAAKLGQGCQWPNLPLGLDQFMKPVRVNPETHGALYWVAPPRSGKTQSMRATLYLALRSAYDVRFLVCAIPSKIQKDWGIFAGISGCLGLVSDFAEMEQALGWAVEQMNSGASRGKTIIILDDLTSLMNQAPAIGSHIDNLALTGPGLGYHLLCGTHGAGSIATTGGTLSQFAMTCKILYKAADNTAGARSSGRKNSETGLAQLSGEPGDAILDEHGRITRVATAWVQDADVLTLPPAHEPMSRPWRQAVTNHTPSQGLSQPVTSGSPPLSRLSQPVTPPPTNGHATADRGGDGHTVTPRDSVTPVTKESLLAQLPALFPVNPERPLNPSEERWLRFLFDSNLFSESALADVAYGQRNKRRLTYVREALARTNDPVMALRRTRPLAETLNLAPLMTEALAVAILEGNPAHPRRAEALAFFQLTKETLYEDS